MPLILSPDLDYYGGMDTTIRHLRDLTPDTRNANKGSERGQHLIEESLRQYGAGRSILIDKNGVIMAGNKTAENFGAIGLDDVIVVQTDGTKLVAVQRTDLDMMADPRARELAIADNRASEVSLDWNADVLKELGEEIDLTKFWSADELAALLPPVTTDLLTDEDDVPPVPDEPKSKLGDLYRLGDHRLLCGDSTCVTDVERLMDGQKADMVFTDPPYGVDYDGGTTKREKLAGDNSTALYEPACMMAQMFTEPKASLYLWHAGVKGIAAAAAAAAAAAGYEIRCEIVWNKNQAQFGALSAQYKQKHEPCYYCFKKGIPPYWFGPTNETTVWDIDRASKNEFHPTQKPVALAERAFGNSCPANGKVLDLFGGSGSTLIACEKTGRHCRMMELDPKFCDVIVARWEAVTGKKAELV
jgi:site-specific DNA-methyltransferase (adenine-specific)